MGAKKTFKGIRKFKDEYEPWVNALPETPPKECRRNAAAGRSHSVAFLCVSVPASERRVDSHVLVDEETMTIRASADR